MTELQGMQQQAFHALHLTLLISNCSKPVEHACSMLMWTCYDHFSKHVCQYLWLRCAALRLLFAVRQDSMGRALAKGWTETERISKLRMW